MRITLSDLLALTVEPLRRKVRIWWINRKIAAEYVHLEYFRWQVKNGNAGIADTSKRIVNLENSKGL